MNLAALPCDGVGEDKEGTETGSLCLMHEKEIGGKKGGLMKPPGGKEKTRDSTQGKRKRVRACMKKILSGWKRNAGQLGKRRRKEAHPWPRTRGKGAHTVRLGERGRRTTAEGEGSLLIREGKESPPQSTGGRGRKKKAAETGYAKSEKKPFTSEEVRRQAPLKGKGSSSKSGRGTAPSASKGGLRKEKRNVTFLARQIEEKKTPSRQENRMLVALPAGEKGVTPSRVRKKKLKGKVSHPGGGKAVLWIKEKKKKGREVVLPPRLTALFRWAASRKRKKKETR